jgi:hypothetical protein
MTRLLATLVAAASSPLAAQGASQLPAIPEGQLVAQSRTVKSLRVEPQTITMKVGEKVDLNRFVVTVLDSSGKAVGRLAGFDFTQLGPNEPASVMPRVLTGLRPGTTEITFRYPRNFWKRPDPRAEAKVKIVVVK